MIEFEWTLGMIEALRSYPGLSKTSWTALVAAFFIPNEIDYKKCPSNLGTQFSYDMSIPK